jgi:hypothetical protein
MYFRLNILEPYHSAYRKNLAGENGLLVMRHTRIPYLRTAWAGKLVCSAKENIVEDDNL